MKKKVLKFVFILSFFSFLLIAAYADSKTVKIGVLAYRGKDRCVELWQKTGDYLSSKVKGNKFIIVPLSFEEVDKSVRLKEVDFVLVNSAIYISLSKKYKVSRIATLEKLFQGRALSVFGGVIFTRADNNRIKSIRDLRNKTFMAVKSTSFGGWQMAFLVMKEKGFDPYEKLKSLSFGNTHDKVVMAVRNGEVDAGTVRTDILESMESEGKIKLSEFKIINQHKYPTHRFPLLCSTNLYPEWPFAKLPHVSSKLSTKVAMALMSMNIDNPAAKTAQIAGWSPPLNYQSVEECLRELRVDPFADYGKITLRNLWKSYKTYIVLIALFFLLIIIYTIYIIFINKKLRLNIRARQKELAKRKRAEREILQIFNTSGDGMRVLLTDGTIFKVNEQYLNMVGYSRNEIENKICKDFCSDPSHFDTDECILKKILYTDRIETDFNLKRKDGSIIPTIMTAVPYYNTEKEVIGTIQVFKDISDRLELEKASALEAEQRGRVEMASSVLFDINNAVNSIDDISSNYTNRKPWTELEALEKLKKILKSPESKTHKMEMLLEKSKELLDLRKNKMQDAFINISRNISHMKDILNIQRAYANPSMKLNSTVNIVDLIEDAVAMFSASIQKRNIDVKYHFAENLPELELDNTRMLQVLINILKNACEAFDAQEGNINRFIFIRATCRNNMLNIGIVDNACGVSREEQKLLCNKGYSTKGQAGMGLYQSRLIVEAHKGKVEVHSDGKDKGTTIKVSLPVPK
jgi:two-component system sensor histidine kinase TtrS